MAGHICASMCFWFMLLQINKALCVIEFLALVRYGTTTEKKVKKFVSNSAITEFDTTYLKTSLRYFLTRSISFV